MPSSVSSLFWISLCSVIAPMVAGLMPRRLVPEVVLLLVGGVLIGPHMLDWAATDEAIEMLRQLGLGMLFLLAGYEIELKELTSHAGRRAFVTWLLSLGSAMVFVVVLGSSGLIHSEIAVAIALTSTALGTLLPILKDSGMVGGRIGNAILAHGAFGELGPIVAMAMLLGATGPLGSLIGLSLFAAVAVVVSLPSRLLRRETSKLLELIRLGSETTGQTPVRLTMLLLITLGATAAAFHFDIVLGAFSAGFVLRRALPGGDERLETKLDGIAFGLLIPVFFVTSGMAIDPQEVIDHPGVLVAFVASIVVLRGGWVLVSSLLDRDRETGARRFTPARALAIATYAATGLPIIVAVTSVAVSDGQMSTGNASVLVAGGAVTVLFFPAIATVLARSPERV